MKKLNHLYHPKYRPDIDGLRGFAVLFVVLFHAFPKFVRGAFIGVDVFFVISGFLISTIIMESLDNENFSFLEFYSRRIRRIFPALIVILIVAFCFGWLVLYPDEFRVLGKHIAGGATFSSNFILLNESGYFDTASEAKPLLHLWSLGIEEQFYILCPAIFWLAKKYKLNYLLLAIVVFLISFALNIHEYDTARLFFAPQMRAWELMVGVMLAAWNKQSGLKMLFENFIVQHRFFRNLWNGNCKSSTGFLLVFLGIALIDKNAFFPGWWGLLPTIGTALLISGGVDTWINRNILASRILIWVGKISFPLYLWHWVILSYVHIMERGDPTRLIKIAAVILSFLFAHMTYRLIEVPLRYGRYNKVKSISLLFIMIMIGLIGYSTYAGSVIAATQAERYSAEQQNNSSQLYWPKSNNSSRACVQRFGERYADNYCLVDDPSKDSEIMLIGDSNADHFYHGLNRALPGKNLLLLGQGGCLPFYHVSTQFHPNTTECLLTMGYALDYAIKTKSVKTVILSMLGEGYLNTELDNRKESALHLQTSDGTIRKPSAIFELTMRDTLEKLIDAQKDVVFIISIPRLNFHPEECLENRPLFITKKTRLNPCAITRSAFNEDNDEFRQIVIKVLRDFPQVKVFDSAAELCNEKLCRAMINNKLLYRDRNHLSIQGSYYFGPKIAALINN